MSDRIAVMSKGKILQVGSPRDIYDRPDQRFVADFIGEANFLQGTVCGDNAGRRNGAACRPGAMTQPGFRAGFQPRAMRHRRGPARACTDDRARPMQRNPDRNAGKSAVYFGTDTHFIVRLPDGIAFVVRHQNSRTAEACSSRSARRSACAVTDQAAQVLRD